MEDWTGIVKIIFIALLVGIIVLLVGNNVNTNVDMDIVSVNVTEAGDMSKLELQDDLSIKRTFGLNANDYNQVMYYKALSSMDVDELFIVRANDDAQIEEIIASMNSRIEEQTGNFEGYGVDQTELLKNSVVYSLGNYVILIISPDADDMKNAFDNCFE